MSLTRTILVLGLLLAAPDVSAVTKVDEGFSNGNSPRRLSRFATDEPVYYWVQLKDYPAGRGNTRCLVKGPKGDTLVDETHEWNDNDTEPLLYCGVDGDEKELDEGKHILTIYLNGEVISESFVVVHKAPFLGSMSMTKKLKYGLGILAAILLGYYWIRKKLYGDKTIDAAFPEKAKKGAKP